ncbi:putative Lysosomal Pro-X carboxypeptidase [Paratrimastix pyriformis]|uniref:Lysosomal Pro-X carboxypeptidase n=1 Tax=Paratrimastix pyriformis TaxID=342808 RepID=A0ABQ8UFZ2_9EUKA|nr:putative Lysosomal Pro-X carboxypeptidase [Paratrimastix pyriformis]
MPRVGIVSSRVYTATATTEYFEQPLDHFSFTSEGTFKQRYLVDSTFYGGKEGAPILFYTGNEGDISTFYKNSGYLKTLAQDLGALLVFAEHRYYGNSLPFGDRSFEPDHVRYLTSAQALADYADLCVELQERFGGPGNRPPVVAFGGSYGGMLAAWFRIKYPHLVAGAISSSGPVRGFDGLMEPTLFNQIATTDFAQADPKCADTIAKAHRAIAALAAQGAPGLARITSSARLCHPLGPKDVPTLLGYLSDGLGFLAMLDYPYPTVFLGPLPAWPVTAACQALAAAAPSPGAGDTPESLIGQLVAAVGIFYNGTGAQACFDLADHGSADLGWDGWDYQACTEMVFPSGSNGQTDFYLPAAWNLTDYLAQCAARWGKASQPRPRAGPTLYGLSRPADLQGLSNLIITNGGLDPWSAGGLLPTTARKLGSAERASPAGRLVVERVGAGPEAPQVLLMPGAAHHLDLRAPNPADPRAVVEARALMADAVRRWVAAWRAH